MKRSMFVLFVVLIVAVLSACSTPLAAIPVSSSGSQPTPVEEVSTPASSEALPPAVEAAIHELESRISLPVGESVKLVSYEAVEWPNGCLGVERAGVMCTMMVTPGYRVIMEAAGAQYESHTNQDGSVIVNADSSAPENQAGAIQAAINVLSSELGIPASEITLFSDSSIEFADACLGIAIPGMSCLQQVTPGHIIVLEANGVQYEVHTDESGNIVQMATLALSWHREGGVAGFNDDLVIFLPDRVFSSSKTKQAGDGLGVLLSKDELAQWNEWLATYGDQQITVKDGGTADGMTTTLYFNGNGSQVPDEATKQAMLSFAQNLFNKMNQ